jgi:hypothetical protein
MAPRLAGSPNTVLRKLPPRIKKRVNVTIETIMEPQFEREEDEDRGDSPGRRRSSNT